MREIKFSCQSRRQVACTAICYVNRRTGRIYRARSGSRGAHAACRRRFTALPIFSCVFASISRISCSEITQKFSCRSPTVARVLSRSSRKPRTRSRDIFAPRYLTGLIDLFKRDRRSIERWTELAPLLLFVALPLAVVLRVATAISMLLLFADELTACEILEFHSDSGFCSLGWERLGAIQKQWIRELNFATDATTETCNAASNSGISLIRLLRLPVIPLCVLWIRKTAPD